MSETENTRKESSNMDAKRVMVEGEQDDDLQTEEVGKPRIANAEKSPN